MPATIRTIVAGVASAEGDEPTLDAALALARATGAALHVVHAYDIPALVAAPPEVAGYSHELWERYTADVGGRLEKLLRARAAVPRMSVRAVPGPPGPVLVELAQSLEADLVVVGASRHGALHRALLGTTAQRVLRSSPVPVLVVRGPLAIPPRRVLLATDLSTLGAAVHERALDVVEALAPRADPEVRALTVVPHDAPPPAGTGERAARVELADFLAPLRPRRYPVEPAARLDAVAPGIVREAEEWRPDLLVLGTHARRGAQRFFLGSVAEAVVRAAPCAALVIPPVAVGWERHPGRGYEPAFAAARAAVPA